MKLFRYVLCFAVLLAWALPLGAAPAQAATPAITLSPDSGPAGTSVTVTGTGFPKKTSGTVSAGLNSAANKTMMVHRTTREPLKTAARCSI